MLDSERQRLLDEEHLRLLRIGYLIDGATHAVFALFPLLYIAMGVFVASSLANQPHRPSDPDPRFIGWIFAIFGGVFSLFFVTSATLKLLTARALRLHQHRTLCLITAGITCLGIPYGTALGVLTFFVLSRQSVLSLFSPGAGLPPVYAPAPPSTGSA